MKERLTFFHLFEKFENNSQFKGYIFDHETLHSFNTVSRKLFETLGKMLNLSTHFPLLYYF
jgi:hypothetical protein